jgi:hypothetical protein
MIRRHRGAGPVEVCALSDDFWKTEGDAFLAGATGLALTQQQESKKRSLPPSRRSDVDPVGFDLEPAEKPETPPRDD